MELLKKWEELTNKERGKEENESFWKGYLLKETSAYEIILNEKRNNITGKTTDIAKELGLDTTFFTGFLDGINTSLNKSVDLETLTDDSEIEIDINFENLYLNMLKAKADWLYDLEAWNDILSDEKKSEIKKEFSKSQMAKSKKVGRNDACPCGSGKKFKKCCINK